jgi:hypothetical protein
MAKAKAGFAAAVAAVRTRPTSGRYRRAESTALAGFSYNKGLKKLTVTFARTGARYRYSDVPPDVWEALNLSASHGQFFNQFIRNNYDFEEV